METLANVPWGSCRQVVQVTAETVEPGVADGTWTSKLGAIPVDVSASDVAYGWLLASRCEAHKNGALTIPDLRLTDARWVDRAAGCAELAAIAASVGCHPHDGSRERAKAAWSFICDNLPPDHPSRDQYRRELAAM